MRQLIKTGSIGPWEPPGFNLIRDQYWAHYAWLTQLEARLSRTPAGHTWLMRVKRIGRSRG